MQWRAAATKNCSNNPLGLFACVWHMCACVLPWRACPLSVSVRVLAAWHILCARMLLGVLLARMLPAAYARPLPISMHMPCAHSCARYTLGALVRCLAHISRAAHQPASCCHTPARVQTCLVFSHVRCLIMLGTRPQAKHWHASSFKAVTLIHGLWPKEELLL